MIFQKIREKPRFEAVRVGRKSADNTRPVKVSLGSTVHQILVKAKNLRQCQVHKNVFISPDRSPEDRAILDSSSTVSIEGETVCKIGHT